MKKLLLILLIIFFVNTGCEKNSTFVNQPPDVYAGANFGVFLPVDTARLSGNATDTENNIDSCRWKQISGPGQAVIQTPYSLQTKISNLIEGEYSFELTVIDRGKLSGKDTANIVVTDTAVTNFIIFKVLGVECSQPDCTIFVETSNASIFQNLPIKIFLKSLDSSVWVSIPHQNLYFSPDNLYFWIEWYGVDEFKEWEVMIVY